jgi:hypothetical protein
MGFFDKAPKKNKAEESNPPETQVNFPLSMPPEESPPDASQAGSVATSEAEPPDRDLEEVGPEQGPGTHSDLGGESVAGDILSAANGLEAEDEPSGDTDPGDELMDIFTSEEEEDVDLSVLTEGLEELQMQSLLAEARDVSAGLRAFNNRD